MGNTYTVRLSNKKMFEVYYTGLEKDVFDLFGKLFRHENIDAIQPTRSDVMASDLAGKPVLFGSGTADGGATLRLLTGEIIPKDKINKLISPSDFDYNSEQIYQEVSFETPKDDPDQANLEGFENDELVEFSDNVTGRELLGELLGSRPNRAEFFRQQSVNPALQRMGGGTNTLESALMRGFDPVDAAFQIENLLAPAGFESGIDDPQSFLTSFNEYSGGIPTTQDIRNRLRDLVERRQLGTDHASGRGLSRSAMDLLQDEGRQQEFIRAAMGDFREAPGFMRGAIRQAINDKITQRLFNAPGGDLLNSYVNAGFRL